MNGWLIGIFLQVAGESLGDEFKGYIFKITGGNDKQGTHTKHLSPMSEKHLDNGEPLSTRTTMLTIL
jgi:ribosomal protein S6E (S10)